MQNTFWGQEANAKMHRRGFEPPTTWSEVRYSIQLSYRCYYSNCCKKNNKSRHFFPSEMNEKYIEGIVLKSIPFRECDRILHLFTAEKGVIALFAKRISTKCPLKINLTSSLCRAKFIFQKRRSDLYYLIDGTIIDLHLGLRRSYTHLQVGGKMLQLIFTSQMPGKSVPSLYALLVAYLQQLSNFSDPTSLWASFQLKLLRHEGLLSLHTICSSCFKERASCITQGESRCEKCGDRSSPHFSRDEWGTLLHLSCARKFETLRDLQVSSALLRNVEAVYHLSYNAVKPGHSWPGCKVDY